MRFLPIIFAACLMAGCRNAKSISEFDKDRVYRLDLLQPREHQTSQDTVLRIMGPADAVSADQQAWAYHWRTDRPGENWLTVGWQWTGFYREYWTKGESRLHLLLLEFEASGLLVRKHIWVAVEPPEGLPPTRDILEQWHAQANPSPATAPVIPSPDP